MEFGYIAYLDDNCTELELFELDRMGFVINRESLHGQEQSYRQYLSDNKTIQICELKRGNHDGESGVFTKPLARIYIDKKWHNVENFFRRADPELIVKMFDDFYSNYVDRLLIEQDEYHGDE